MKYNNIKIVLASIFISIIIFFVGISAINKIYNNGKSLQKNDTGIIPLDKKDQLEGIFSVKDIKTKDKEIKKIISATCPIPKKENEEEYEDMSLLNIGQEVGLPDPAYIPEDLEELDEGLSTKKGICLIAEAKDSFSSMVEDALEDEYSIKVSSGFRSYEYQKNLLANAIKSGQKDASVSIAKAGYSEHQLGTAMDITGASINYDSASSSFDKTSEDFWLRENAYLYGFIQSYPKNKENITGYKYEPWHYRYVGISKAKEIKDSGLTITEFLAN